MLTTFIIMFYSTLVNFFVWSILGLTLGLPSFTVIQSRHHCWKLLLLWANAGSEWHYLGNDSSFDFPFPFLSHLPEILGTNCNYFQLTASSWFTCIPESMSSLQISVYPLSAAICRAVWLRYRKQYIKITENIEILSFLLTSMISVKSMGKNSIGLHMNIKHDWQCNCQISKVGMDLRCWIFNAVSWIFFLSELFLDPLICLYVKLTIRSSFFCHI